MAVCRKRGWQWTEEERSCRQKSLAKARRTAAQIAAQIPSIEKHAREFLGRAKLICDALCKAISEVAGIDLRRSSRRKYQPISPADVDAALGKYNKALKDWSAMTSAPEYQALVRAANRLTRRENARICEQHRQAMAELERQADQQEEALSGNVWSIMERLVRSNKERDNTIE